MDTSTKLAQRFREVILNGTWIANTNFRDQLTDLDVEIANSQVQSLNTISILAQHIHYYIVGVKNVFKGGELAISDRLSFSFEPFSTQIEWDVFLEKLWIDAEEFANLIERFSNEKLQENFVNIQYGTYGRNIEAMIEHCYYHLGQITLIKKLLVGKQI